MASQFGLQIDGIEVRTREEVSGTFDKAKALGADVMFVVGDAVFSTPPTRVPELAAQARLPAIYMFLEMVQAGGLIAYTIDFLWIARRHAQLVDRVLRGFSPAEIPIDHEVRPGRQPQHRKSPWAHHIAIASRSRQRGDRVRASRAE